MKQERWRTKCKRRNNFVPFIQEPVRSLEWQQRGQKALVWVKSETPEFCHCLLKHSQNTCVPRSNFLQWSSSVREFLCPRHSFERRKQWSRIHVWQLFPLSFNSLWDRRIYKSQSCSGYSRYFSRNAPSGPEERVQFFSPDFIQQYRKQSLLKDEETSRDKTQ